MKLFKSRKALSPVVASIILIAVTVAVSIAVAAWMGALSFSFMGGSEQLQVGTPYGWTDGGTTVNVLVTNNGGAQVEISTSRINGTVCAISPLSPKLAPGVSQVLTITLPSGTFVAPYSYQVIIVTKTNHEFLTLGTVTP